MKAFLAAPLLGILLLQQSVAQYNAPARGSHPPVTAGTIVRVPAVTTRDVFTELLTIGVENQIPMGIVVGDAQGMSICQVRLNVKSGDKMSVSELITAIEAGAPGYGATLDNGVLEVAPKQLPVGAARLLDLMLPEFQSTPQPHDLVGRDLWKYIRGVIAPNLGVDTSGSFSAEAETVRVKNVTNEPVKSILNMIVDQGHGGVWVLRSSQVKELTQETRMPYVIHGYVGEGPYLGSMLSCAKL